MDFPDLNPIQFEGVRFMISDLFKKDYYSEYALTGDDAMCRVIRGIDVYFSVDLFTDYDADVFMEEFDADMKPIDAIHDYYIMKRKGSLVDPFTSIKKELPPSVKFPGYLQVVQGTEYEYDDPSSYFTATLQVGEEYYVFQMIGKSENMGYLYDDFIDLLSSVQ